MASTHENVLARNCLNKNSNIMEKTRFQYGGYTFVPDGTFKSHGIKKGKREFYYLSRALHYPNSGCVADGDEKFDYEEFYRASGDSKDDIFLCEENGERYVPCAKVLAVFDKDNTDEAVCARYERRQQEREDREHFLKQEALKKAMVLNDKQSSAINALREAAFACCDVGLNFAVDGTDVYVFRADRLTDITEDMASQNGQEHIETGMYLAIENAWDACDGLYANFR